MQPLTRIEHPIPPTWDARSEVLILGSFPSVKSRESGYFYGHPQNRFWRLLALLYGESCPVGNAGKRAFLLRHRLAVWDVIASCEIVGSSDSSITNAVANDLTPILAGSRVTRIFCNGTTSYRLYGKYIQPVTGIEAVCLPSTSPANAAWSLDRLIETWGAALNP